jgi:hypothetical protein
MHEHTDRGKIGKGHDGRKWTPFVRLAWCFLPVAFSACATPHQATAPGTGPAAPAAAGPNLKNDDPLLGGPPLPPSGHGLPAPPAPAPAPAPGGPTASVPPATIPASATSNAVLAAGVVRPRDPERDLRIAEPNAGGGWGNPAPVAGPGGGAVLHSPEPPGQSAAPRDPMQAPTFGTSGRPTSFEQAQPLLKARGVTWQRLETVAATGEWQFSCSVPNRQNPNVNHQYKGTGATDLAAIQAVLDQIDRGN